MTALSLVIPIYNVEKYIEECLLSIVKSMKSLKGIEIIMVDDGSTDQSGEIAKKYSRKYSNFSYYFKENGGLSDARNYGLQQVKSKYVSFLDSDDYIADNYFSEVFKSIQSSPDLIIFDWVDFHDDKSVKLVKGMDIPTSLWSVLPSACNKVYKKSIFDEIQFPIGKIYEDVATTYKLLYYVKEFTYIDKPLYIYRKNREGSILTSTSPKINDIYFALDDTYGFYQNKNALSKENADGLCYQYVKLLLWSNMYRQLKFYKFQYFNFYKKMKYTRSKVYSTFPSWKDNEFLVENRDYFEKRLGSNHINKLDKVGKGYWSTLITTFSLIVRNRNM